MEYPEVTFLGIGLDGTEVEFDEFVNDNGVTSLTHITNETDPELVDSFFEDFAVNAVPTFVISNDNGEVRDLAGWSESNIREDLDWLVTS